MEAAGEVKAKEATGSQSSCENTGQTNGGKADEYNLNMHVLVEQHCLCEKQKAARRAGRERIADWRMACNLIMAIIAACRI